MEAGRVGRRENHQREETKKCSGKFVPDLVSLVCTVHFDYCNWLESAKWAHSSKPPTAADKLKISLGNGSAGT